ncbi:MAG: hypothetical protein WBE58_02455 [Verrucomicrobiales bacterium]
MVERYCLPCQYTATPKDGLDLESFLSLEAMLENCKLWEKVLKQLKADAIPPDGKNRPTEAEREEAVTWLERELIHGDGSRPVPPGRVTARRLNRTACNHTIRDSFGVSLKLAALRGVQRGGIFKINIGPRNQCDRD